ncbi:MAG: restriction endonuclease subunit S [Muribaculaceae bacterium]|nr:restriction endonuclease subunit S [Muribaculaceae bacterium]
MELLSVTMNEGVKRRSEIEGKDNSSEDKSNYKIVHIGDMVYNSMRMWQGASGISQYYGIVSPAYTVLKPKMPIANEFFAALFKTRKLVQTFQKNSQGLTSDTWNLKYPQIAPIKISIPSLQEQTKIAKMLTLLDLRIKQQEQLVSFFKSYKRGAIAHYFTMQMHNTKWQKTTISKCLFYEQPQKYIVHSEHYSDTYATPVLTANKAFILGYTNETDGIYNKGEVLIYDDFTMDIKYVNFPFKVKSSTIKMLTPQENIDLYFMYSLLQYLELKPEGHQRSYISILEPTEVQIPLYEEQLRAAKLFRLLDRKIEKEQILLQGMIKMKTSLMQQLFI